MARRKRHYGFEAAEKHIREAEELSKTLGGTDKDVKAYFLGLSENKLEEVFSEYEKLHGVSHETMLKKHSLDGNLGARR